MTLEIGQKIKAKSANHSPLMKALGKASQGEKPNFCPHGCEEHDLDENGYCKHLVGFTLPGDETRMEPREPRLAKGLIVGYFVNGKAVRPVPKGAKLVQITCSSRVYHKDPLPELSDAELEAATRPS